MTTVAFRRQSRHLRVIDCQRCGGVNFMGAHVCFYCTVPIFYEAHLPGRSRFDPRWNDIQALTLEDRWIGTFNNVLEEARAVKRLILHAVFNVKPPPQSVLDKRGEYERTWCTWDTGKYIRQIAGSQAEVFDQGWSSTVYQCYGSHQPECAVQKNIGQLHN